MNKEKLVELKRKLALLSLAGTLTLSGAGCAKTNKVETENTQNNITTEATVLSDNAKTDVNAELENFAETNYSTYQEFYDSIGIDKDQIKNMYLFINDIYEDENSNALMSVDDLGLAYMNVESVMLPYKVSQKIDNINTINHGDIKPEDDGVVIPSIPKLSEFIDQSKAGASITTRKLQEYEDELNYQVNLMNSDRTFDTKHMNKFIKKNEVTDYNNDDTGLSSTTSIGFRFLLSDSHKYALKMDGAMQPQVNFIEGNDGIKDIKINAFNAERKTEDMVENLKEENLLDSDTIDSITNKVIDIYNDGNSITPKEIASDYDISIDNSNLLIDYAIYLSTMQYYMYERMDCNLKREATDKLYNINGLSENKTNTLTK